MEKLNDEMLYLEKQKDKLRSEISESKLAKKEYQQLREKLLLEQDHIIESIRTKEEKKWNELKDDVKELLRELQQKKDISNPEVAQIKYQLNQKATQDQKLNFDDELKVDDPVYIIPYQQYGLIKAIKGEDYRVVFGQFDLYFKSYDLRKEEKKVETKKVVKQVKTTIGQTPTKKANYELDLRGFRFEEVKDELDQAIDAALLSGLSVMRIIHGFGSGAVRKAVYDYIKSSPYIKTSRFGGEGEGLNGVTIITLK